MLSFGCRKHAICGTPSRTLLSDSYLSGLAIIGVSSFVYRGYTENDNNITASGITDFFIDSLRWRAGSLILKPGSRKLKLYCMNNCAEAAAGVIEVSQFDIKAPFENFGRTHQAVKQRACQQGAVTGVAFDRRGASQQCYHCAKSAEQS